MAKHLMAAIMLCVLAGGCTIVQLGSPAEIVTVSPGVLRIEPGGGATSIAYRTTGIGLIPTYRGATLGYATETVVAMRGHDDCRIVLFETDEATARKLVELLSPVVGADGVCGVGELP